MSDPSASHNPPKMSQSRSVDEVSDTPAAALSVLVVVGPTASGKSELAARLGALLDGEVINADSVQIYRRFDIGSGKPSPEELALCPHHLLDILDAKQPIDASRFADLADLAIQEVHARGRVPIVCGGTFLWVRALLSGLADAPPGDESLRDEHKAFAREHGRPALHQRLQAVDPESGARLHPNDLVRVSRALEVHQLTGRKLSTLHAEHGFASERYQATLLGIDWPRAEYDVRVAKRTHKMLAAGFVNEVGSLLAAGYGDTRAMDSVGYRQVRDALRAESTDEEALAEEVIRVTRVFARRQRTWLRDRDVRWLPPDILTTGLEQLADELKLHLAERHE